MIIIVSSNFEIEDKMIQNERFKQQQKRIIECIPNLDSLI